MESRASWYTNVPRARSPTPLRICSPPPDASPRSCASEPSALGRSSRRSTWRVDTPPSTETPSLMPRIDRRVLRALSWILAVAVVIYVGRSLAHGLTDLYAHPLPHPPNWWLVLLSGAVFLSGHAVLVQ